MSENPNTNDLLTTLDAMYEAANRRAEAEKWRDPYATGYSDGIWDARTRVRESPNWQKAYEEEQALRTSVVDQYRHLEGEMDGLVRLTDTIRELAVDGLDGSDLSDWLYALAGILRIMSDGDDA